jgi:hypothetical protein
MDGLRWSRLSERPAEEGLGFDMHSSSSYSLFDDGERAVGECARRQMMLSVWTLVGMVGWCLGGGGSCGRTGCFIRRIHSRNVRLFSA